MNLIIYFIFLMMCEHGYASLSKDWTCDTINGEGVCTCKPGFLGVPPDCHHECEFNSDCPTGKNCINKHCMDPCLGTCGTRATCSVVNHIPICSCPEGTTGNPFEKCFNIIECSKDEECSPNTACILQHCRDPCIGACGLGATCEVTEHKPECRCPGDRGNPDVTCLEHDECEGDYHCPQDKACENRSCKDPCVGACGIGAVCTVSNHVPECKCPDNRGDPDFECLGEEVCQTNDDCQEYEACIAQQCQDPCYGECGLEETCTAIAHKAVCSPEEELINKEDKYLSEFNYE